MVSVSRRSSGQLGLQLLRLLCVFLRLCGQGVYLSPAGKNGRVLIDGTAGKAAAGIHHLAIQRHHPVAVAICLGDGGRGVNVLRHNGASQQGIHHHTVAVIALHQLAGQAHIAASGS